MGFGDSIDKMQSAVNDFFGSNSESGEKVGNIILGDIKIEIPPERNIDFTGLRAMVKYDVPGDRPRYQDMGRDERTVRWNGIFAGNGAYKQALVLQKYYDSGVNTDDGTEKSGFLFIFGEISCRVMIKSFNYQYYRKDKVRYDIELVRLESDYDKEEPEQTAKTDDITKAKNSLSKLKNDIKKGMQVVNDVSKAAGLVNETLYQARREYLNVTKLITNPIRDARDQIKKVKESFDKSLQAVNQSIGQVSTPAARKELKEAFVLVEKNLPLAEQLVLMAEKDSYGARLDELISQMKTRRVYSGDTLRSIATEVYGYPHKWMILAQINHLPTADLPSNVKQIRIPDVSNSAQVEELLDNQRALLPKSQSTYIPVNLR